MSLSGDDAQATQGSHLLMIRGPLAAYGCDLLRLGGDIQGFIKFNRGDGLLHIATEHNIRTPACHVGGNRDHFCATRLGHDVRLSRMLLGVQDLVGQFFGIQQLGDDFRIFNRRRSHQNRLAALVALPNVLNRCFVFFTRSFVDSI